MNADRHSTATARAEELRRNLVLKGALTVRRTEDGGRSHPISSRYMADALLSGAPDTVLPAEPLYGCAVHFIGDPILPGATRDVGLVPRIPSYWSAVSANDKLGLYEGRRRIATFKVRIALAAGVLRELQEAEAAATPEPHEIDARVKSIKRAVERYASRDIDRR